VAFTNGLDRWDLERGFRRDADPSRPQDYSAAADASSASLSSAVPEPRGSAALVQSIFADDYRGATVVFRGGIRTESLTEQAGLRLEILRQWWRVGQAREDHGVTVSGRHDWTEHEITALIPEDTDIIRSAAPSAPHCAAACPATTRPPSDNTLAAVPQHRRHHRKPPRPDHHPSPCTPTDRYTGACARSRGRRRGGAGRDDVARE
jgi:hypothetical protein